jgi:hypothetical protein
MILLALSGGWSLADPPSTVSPGTPGQPGNIEQACPTFSWGAVDGAQSYELVVFDALPEEGTRVHMLRRARQRMGHRGPVIRTTIPAPALSWTPSAEQCLVRGESYVWHVREIDDDGSFPGEWSEGSWFRVTPAAATDSWAGEEDADNNPGNRPGNGTGGIPEVLYQLDQLSQQIDDNQAQLNQRFDELEAHIDSRFDQLTLDLTAHNDLVAPCTPQRWREGKCDPLDLEATYCFNVELGGALGVEYAFAPHYNLALGGAWTNAPDVELKADFTMPLVLQAAPPVLPPVILPDVKAGVGVGAGASMQICFDGVKLRDMGLESGEAVDDFAQNLVTALEERSDQIRQAAVDLMEGRSVNTERFASALEKLQAVKGVRKGEDENDRPDPLQMLKRGEFRDLVDSLPIDETVHDLLEDPASMIPNLSPDEPFGLCDDLRGMEFVSSKPGLLSFCDFVETLPDLMSLPETFENFPDDFIDEICDTTSIDCNLGATATCKRECRQTARQCRRDCGLLNIDCRQGCNNQKSSCINSCN